MNVTMDATAATRPQVSADATWPVIAKLLLAVASHRLRLIAVRKSIGRYRRRQARRQQRGRR
jgi:hypothetical protein